MITKEPQFINYVGQKFNDLRVMKFGKVYEGKVFWLCECDCGIDVMAKMSDLKSEKVKNCGRCEERKNIYSRWKDMVKRCNNPNSTGYKNYGGRGITVCDEWRDFEKFLLWSLVTGYSKDLQLDRRDNNKGYHPDNCRWVTARENQLNRRDNVHIEIDGETKILSEWCSEYSVISTTLRSRMQRGWEGSDLLLPAGSKRKNLIN